MVVILLLSHDLQVSAQFALIEHAEIIKNSICDHEIGMTLQPIQYVRHQLQL
jgi:hypothetical protein